MKIQVFWDGTLCRLVNGNRIVGGRFCPVSTGSSSLVIIYQSIRRNAPKYFNFLTYVDTGTHRLFIGSNSEIQYAQYCFGHVFYSCWVPHIRAAIFDSNNARLCWRRCAASLSSPIRPGLLLGHFFTRFEVSGTLRRFSCLSSNMLFHRATCFGAYSVVLRLQYIFSWTVNKMCHTC
jgi:hypothetical protein